MGQRWGRDGAEMGQRWGRDGAEMGQRWGRDGAEMGQRWGRDGAEMGQRWGRDVWDPASNLRGTTSRVFLAHSHCFPLRVKIGSFRAGTSH